MYINSSSSLRRLSSAVEQTTVAKEKRGERELESETSKRIIFAGSPIFYYTGLKKGMDGSWKKVCSVGCGLVSV